MFQAGLRRFGKDFHAICRSMPALAARTGAVLVRYYYGVWKLRATPRARAWYREQAKVRDWALQIGIKGTCDKGHLATCVGDFVLFHLKTVQELRAALWAGNGRGQVEGRGGHGQQTLFFVVGNPWVLDRSARKLWVMVRDADLVQN